MASQSETIELISGQLQYLRLRQIQPQ